MTPYGATIAIAWSLAFKTLRSFPIQSRSQYVIKAGNLAACFLGFSIHKGREYCRRSAELGVLASLFDLTSDGLDFDRVAIDQFERVARSLLDENAAEILFHLMKCKKEGALQNDGLQRGIAALRAIIKHLKAEEAWPHESEIIRTGILLQAVDDILDFDDDIQSSHLNFLRHDSSRFYVDELLAWDHHKQFERSAYPFVLFRAIETAKKIGVTKLSCRQAIPILSTQPAE